MADLASLAILTAIDEVLTGTLGTTRAIAANTFAPGAFEAVQDTQSTLLMSTVARAESRITRAQPHGGRPVPLGNKTIVDLEVAITVDRVFALRAALEHVVRRAAQADAAADTTRIAQALEWANLRQTSGEVATGLVSGRLVWSASTIGDYTIVDDQTGRIRSVHTYKGAAVVTLPIS